MTEGVLRPIKLFFVIDRTRRLTNPAASTCGAGCCR